MQRTTDVRGFRAICAGSFWIENFASGLSITSILEKTEIYAKETALETIKIIRQ